MIKVNYSRQSCSLRSGDVFPLFVGGNVHSCYRVALGIGLEVGASVMSRCRMDVLPALV